MHFSPSWLGQADYVSRAATSCPCIAELFSLYVSGQMALWIDRNLRKDNLLILNSNIQGHSERKPVIQRSAWVIYILTLRKPRYPRTFRAFIWKTLRHHRRYDKLTSWIFSPLCFPKFITMPPPCSSQYQEFGTSSSFRNTSMTGGGVGECTSRWTIYDIWQESRDVSSLARMTAEAAMCRVTTSHNSWP